MFWTREDEMPIEPLPCYDAGPTDLGPADGGIYLEGNEVPVIEAADTQPATVADVFAAYAAAKADTDAKAAELESALARKKATRDAAMAIFDNYDAVSLGGKTLIFVDEADGFREARVASAWTLL